MTLLSIITSRFSCTKIVTFSIKCNTPPKSPHLKCNIPPIGNLLSAILRTRAKQYYCAYAGRRDVHSYLHSHEDVLRRYSGSICMSERVPYALSSSLCDHAYMARFATKKEMREFFAYVTA